MGAGRNAPEGGPRSCRSARAYEQTGRHAAAVELISTIAQPHRERTAFSHASEPPVIRRHLRKPPARHCDLSPAGHRLMEEVRALEPYLMQPDVSLALARVEDPRGSAAGEADRLDRRRDGERGVRLPVRDRARSQAAAEASDHPSVHRDDDHRPRQHRAPRGRRDREQHRRLRNPAAEEGRLWPLANPAPRAASAGEAETPSGRPQAKQRQRRVTLQAFYHEDGD